MCHLLITHMCRVDVHSFSVKLLKSGELIVGVRGQQNLSLVTRANATLWHKIRLRSERDLQVEHSSLPRFNYLLYYLGRSVSRYAKPSKRFINPQPVPLLQLFLILNPDHTNHACSIDG